MHKDLVIGYITTNADLILMQKNFHLVSTLMVNLGFTIANYHAREDEPVL